MRALYSMTLGAALAATTLVSSVHAAPHKAAVFDFELVDSSTEGEMMARGGSADIRGNTDETWEHGAKYLMKRNVLNEPLPEAAAR